VRTTDKVATVSNPAKSNGNVGSVRVGYANGPVDIAVGWGQTTFAPSQQYYVTNIGASWNFGVAKAMFLWNQEAADTLSTNTTVRSNTYMLGATMPLGAGELKGSYTWGNSTNDGVEGSQIAIGYVYNLSKRTALYTTYSYINNDGKVASLHHGINPGSEEEHLGSGLRCEALLLIPGWPCASCESNGQKPPISGLAVFLLPGLAAALWNRRDGRA
jgi:predicted porin